MNKKRLIIILIVEAVLFTLFVLEIIPRSYVRWYALAIAVFLSLAPIEEGLFFFIASIPLFMAIPIEIHISSHVIAFDSLNMWRIFSMLIFLRWLYAFDTQRIKSGNHRFAYVLLALLILAFFSLIEARYKAIGLKRIVYFLNLSLVPIVIFYVSSIRRELPKKLMWAIALSSCFALAGGIIQLGTALAWDVYHFMRFWGEGIQCVQFGLQWCSIAVWNGNTWLAYNGPQLVVRLFSLFPDSHSFPTFLMLGLPAILSIIFGSKDFSIKRSILRARIPLPFVLVICILLAVIVSGTRGYWAAWLFVLLGSFTYAWKIHKQGVPKNIARHLTIIPILFLFLFFIAWPIFSLPQFKNMGDGSRLGNRLRSVIDFGETSNAQRLTIWRSSLVSISNNPLLGVGIANFPVVLSQKIIASKAGSSAHNLYLHIAAEMGLPALAVAIYAILILLRAAHEILIRDSDVPSSLFAGGILLSFVWVFLYVMTDPIIFDERVFLMLGTDVALLLALRYPAPASMSHG